MCGPSRWPSQNLVARDVHCFDRSNLNAAIASLTACRNFAGVITPPQSITGRGLSARNPTLGTFNVSAANLVFNLRPLCLRHRIFNLRVRLSCFFTMNRLTPPAELAPETMGTIDVIGSAHTISHQKTLFLLASVMAGPSLLTFHSRSQTVNKSDNNESLRRRFC